MKAIKRPGPMKAQRKPIETRKRVATHDAKMPPSW